MCEINPKRSAYFTLEFFTSQDMTRDDWNQLVYERLLMLEQELNKDGRVRVHVHESDSEMKEGS
jgi:hypothetical protein